MASKAKSIAKTLLGKNEPEAKADIHPDEQRLIVAIEDNRDKEEGFIEPVATSGVDKVEVSPFTADRIARCLFDPTEEQLPMFTSTPKQQFNVIAIGETFDEAIRLGNKRKASLFSIFINKRDRRAPSVDIGHGSESRNQLVHIYDTMSATETEGDRGSMPW